MTSLGGMGERVTRNVKSAKGGEGRVSINVVASPIPFFKLINLFVHINKS